MPISFLLYPQVKCTTRNNQKAPPGHTHKCNTHGMVLRGRFLSSWAACQALWNVVTVIGGTQITAGSLSSA